MRTRIAVASTLLVLFISANLHASGQAGIYGVIERVVFEPNSQAPERIQIWGAFALIERMSATYVGPNMTTVQGQVFTNYQYQRPTRGYLYFRLPSASADIANATREWADLARVAGTREAVAFGYWDRFRGDARLMRIRSVGVTPDAPDVYLTNVGVARLGTAGNHATIVADLLKLVDKREP
jgi:hypothetical protein